MYTPYLQQTNLPTPLITVRLTGINKHQQANFESMQTHA